MNIITDNWNGNKNESVSFEAKSFDKIKKVLLKLNQENYTQLILEGDNSYLLIGGGNNKYVVTLTIGEDEEFFNLLNPNEQNNETEVDLVTGGQVGSFALKMVVDTELATKAMQYYFENEAKSPQLLWKED